MKLTFKMTVSGLTDLKRVGYESITQQQKIYEYHSNESKEKKLFILTISVVSFFNLEAESIDTANGWTII